MFHRVNIQRGYVQKILQFVVSGTIFADVFTISKSIFPYFQQFNVMERIK